MSEIRNLFVLSIFLFLVSACQFSGKESTSETLQTVITDTQNFSSNTAPIFTEISCEPSSNPWMESPSYDPVIYEVNLFPNIDIAQICSFSGTITRGETYKHLFKDDLLFCLVPGSFSQENINEGWNIVVSDTQQGACDGKLDTYANFGGFVTPPHYGNLSFDVFGYQFRNAENIAENDGSVNTPQMKHGFNFVFSRKDFLLNRYQYRCNRWGLSEDCILATPTSADYVIQRSRMLFEITSIELGNLVPGSSAWIENMSFEVKVYLPEE